MASSRREWVLRFSSSPEFLDVDPEAALSLDGSGRIIGMTKGAERLAPDRDRPLIGRPVEDLLDMSLDDLPDLMRGRPTEERMLRLKDGRALFGHAIAPQSAPVPRRDRMRHRLGPVSGIAGPDPRMQHLAQQAFRLARSGVPVTLLGETGTGKEYLARAMHVAGSAGRRFHALRCARLFPETVDALIEAAPGTLFLRGVQDLDAETQDALLRLLDARDDLRVIASAEAGFDATSAGMRPDLFYRLTGATLCLPALRLRLDFDWLLERLFRRRAPDGLRLSPAARIELAGRDWPGNIRELAHTLGAAIAMADGPVIDVPDLPMRPGRPRDSDAAEQDIVALLAACDGNMSQVARRLGVNRSTVLRRLRKLGLTPES